MGRRRMLIARFFWMVHGGRHMAHGERKKMDISVSFLVTYLHK